jgi:hypothetical protein
MANQHTKRNRKKKSSRDRSRSARSRPLTKSATDKIGAWMESRLTEFQTRFEERMLAMIGSKAEAGTSIPPISDTPEPTPVAEEEPIIVHPPEEVGEDSAVEVPSGAETPENDDDLPNDRDALVKLANDLFLNAQAVANKARQAAEAADAAYVEQKRQERDAGKTKEVDPFAALTPDDIAYAHRSLLAGIRPEDQDDRDILRGERETAGVGSAQLQSPVGHRQPAQQEADHSGRSRQLRLHEREGLLRKQEGEYSKPSRFRRGPTRRSSR